MCSADGEVPWLEAAVGQQPSGGPSAQCWRFTQCLRGVGLTLTWHQLGSLNRFSHISTHDPLPCPCQPHGAEVLGTKTTKSEVMEKSMHFQEGENKSVSFFKNN